MAHGIVRWREALTNPPAESKKKFACSKCDRELDHERGENPGTESPSKTLQQYAASTDPVFWVRLRKGAACMACVAKYMAKDVCPKCGLNVMYADCDDEETRIRERLDAWCHSCGHGLTSDS